MNIRGEEFIPFHDVVALYDSYAESCCVDKLLEVTKNFGIHVDEEKLKKWIKQALFIENFGIENVKDCATRNLMYKLEKENKRLEERNQILYNALDDACDEEDLYWCNKTAQEKNMTLLDYMIDRNSPKGGTPT